MSRTSYLEVEPLGGPHYQGEFWPLTHDDLVAIQAILGWGLPPDYRDFATQFGICRPKELCEVRLLSDESEDPDFSVFYGSHVERAYSLRNWADVFVEPHRLLAFANATNGLFFMAPDGTISFERSGYIRLYEAAESFADFLARLHPQVESD